MSNATGPIRYGNLDQFDSKSPVVSESLSNILLAAPITKADLFCCNTNRYVTILIHRLKMPDGGVLKARPRHEFRTVKFYLYMSALKRFEKKPGVPKDAGLLWIQPA